MQPYLLFTLFGVLVQSLLLYLIHLLLEEEEGGELPQTQGSQDPQGEASGRSTRRQQTPPNGGRSL